MLRPTFASDAASLPALAFASASAFRAAASSASRRRAAGKRLGGGGQRPVPGVEVLAFLLLLFQALEQVAVHRHDLLRLGDEGIDALLQRVPRARRQLRFREIVTLLAQRARRARSSLLLMVYSAWIRRPGVSPILARPLRQ
jgi:hypothetical protein